jgi:hypothetical protein
LLIFACLGINGVVMPNARLALIATSALVLVGVPFVFLAVKPPEMELHFLNGVQVGDSFSAAFGVSNLTGRADIILPVRLETLENGNWKEVKNGLNALIDGPAIGFGLRSLLLLVVFGPRNGLILVPKQASDGKLWQAVPEIQPDLGETFKKGLLAF